MNAGKYTFVIDIPPHFQRDVLGKRQPAIQLNVDATAMVQAGFGSGYAQQIINTEIAVPGPCGAAAITGQSRVRIAFNPISRPHGSSVSWVSSTTSPCWRSSWPALPSFASGSMALWTICW